MSDDEVRCVPSACRDRGRCHRHSRIFVPLKKSLLLPPHPQQEGRIHHKKCRGRREERPLLCVRQHNGPGVRVRRRSLGTSAGTFSASRHGRFYEKGRRPPPPELAQAGAPFIICPATTHRSLFVLRGKLSHPDGISCRELSRGATQTSARHTSAVLRARGGKQRAEAPPREMDLARPAAAFM